MEVVDVDGSQKRAAARSQPPGAKPVSDQNQDTLAEEFPPHDALEQDLGMFLDEVAADPDSLPKLETEPPPEPELRSSAPSSSSRPAAVAEQPAVESLAVGEGDVESCGPAHDNAGREVTRHRIAKWGYFSFSRKSATNAPPHGGFEAMCKWHALNARTGCKKFMRIAGPTDEDEEACLNALCHWCNQANRYDRQRAHMRMPLRPADIPPAAVIEAQKLVAQPPGDVKTDVELDGAAAGGPAAAASATAKPRAKGKAKGEPKPKPTAKAKGKEKRNPKPKPPDSSSKSGDSSSSSSGSSRSSSSSSSD